jgi:hypothetical protein
VAAGHTFLCLSGQRLLDVAKDLNYSVKAAELGYSPDRQIPQHNSQFSAAFGEPSAEAVSA